MDEKGFIIGQSSSTKRILTREAYESGRIKGASQDGNREFITLIASVCADTTSLPPALIYQGESKDLQSSWVEDIEASDQAFFGSSSNGWSNNAFGLAWLNEVFDCNTSKKAGNRRRLLILDGHNSHINMEFINLCDSKRIILIVFPSHTTHRLQPLDIGLFLPLATTYSK